jgi:uncharacterized OsmC-like protein
MDAETLQRIQAPLKDEYRGDPAAALVTLTATGVLGDTAVSCSVDVGRTLVEAGLHPASGGDGTLACSGDLLLQALVACAGVTLRSVAVNRGLDVTGTVTAAGVLDFRGTLGVDREAPVGFVSIDLGFELRTDASADDVAALIRATERYCVIYQTLRAGTAVSVTTTLA